jgi:hypothetical protein
VQNFFQAESFSSNEQFIVSMKESFESFINVRQNKPAELVSQKRPPDKGPSHLRAILNFTPGPQG